MGFFSNKKEKEKKERDQKDIRLAYSKNCPICGNKKFQVICHIQKNSITGTDILTGETAGVCPDCGFIAYGHKFYKGKNDVDSSNIAEMSLKKLNIWHEKMLDLMRNSNLSGNAMAEMINGELDLFLNEIKSEMPDYCQKVDFKYLVKLCVNFNYGKI